MKRAAMFTLLAGTIVAPQSAPKRIAENVAELCVIRDENNGGINILPARVYVKNAQGKFRPLFALTGGESKCIKLPAGASRIQIRSYMPYEPSATDPNQCRSKILFAHLRQSKIVRIWIHPSSEGGHWTCGWEIFTKPAHFDS